MKKIFLSILLGFVYCVGYAQSPTYINTAFNINAGLPVTSDRIATLNDKELTFLGESQKTALSRYAGLVQEGLASSPYKLK